jgi:hypothetical protein
MEARTVIEAAEMSNAVSADVMHDPRLKKLREVTGQVIGSVFYGTLLRTMRESPLKGKYGHGGYGETVFQGQLDQVLAEQAGSAQRGNLTGAVVDRLAKQQLRIESMRSIQHPWGGSRA